MKWLTIGVTLAVFVAALYLSSHVSRQFFPSSDRPELTVDLTLRQNASIFATEQEVKRLEEILKTDPDVEHFSSYVGRGAIRFILTLDVQLANPFFGQFVVVTKDLEARERLRVKLEKVLAEQFPGVVSRVSPLELGPPVGWPLQYRVSARTRTKCGVFRWNWPTWSAPTRARGTCTSTGWSRHASCASRSTRTRPGSSASVRPRSPVCSTPPSPARR
jgi:multidrug efflux pump subunit AcrB